MNKNFTFDDLILYAYNDTDLLKSVRIQHAIDENSALCEEYVELVATMHLMDNFLKEPSESCIDAILEYSKSLNPVTAV
jgi:hypothetical protein